MRQVSSFKNFSSAYGGELSKTRKGRAGPRPISVKHTMHLVLRSSKAVGPWSFRKASNEDAIKNIFLRFGLKFGIKILRLANVGNHLHLQIRIGNRHTFSAFIRATTAAITLAVTRCNAHAPLKKTFADRFFDCRPFTRFVVGRRDFLGIKDYIEINQLEGFGVDRAEAKYIFKARAFD
jgi:REP element-mobilizing transposase RayT